MGVFFSNALVSTIMVLGLIALFWPLIQNGWTRLRSPSTTFTPTRSVSPGRNSGIFLPSLSAATVSASTFAGR